MAIESVFACSFKDCFVPCVITFAVTILILSVIMLIVYFQLVKMAKKKYGVDEGFTSTPSPKLYFPNYQRSRDKPCACNAFREKFF